MQLCESILSPFVSSPWLHSLASLCPFLPSWLFPFLPVLTSFPGSCLVGERGAQVTQSNSPVENEVRSRQVDKEPLIPPRLPSGVLSPGTSQLPPASPNVSLTIPDEALLLRAFVRLCLNGILGFSVCALSSSSCSNCCVIWWAWSWS